MWYIFLAIFVIGSLYGLYLLYRKAGKQGWEAIVPIYGQYVMAQLVGRPTWWIIWLFVPIVNVFIFYDLFLNFIKAFGKRRFWENAAAVLVPFIVLPMWGRDPNTKYLGQSTTEEFKKKYPYKKSTGREWADAIIFATVAATLIRGFLIEAYMIPSGSMERSLLVGDFLFVSKLNYGPRVPMTPIAFPFAHHTMPITGGKAYSEVIKVPYKRLPGFQEIKRNDVVVFNYPEETHRPIDKRENYIKRCVGLPGDAISMEDATLFVNGEKAYTSPEFQTNYIIQTDPNGLDLNRLVELRLELDMNYTNPDQGLYVIHMTKEEAEQVRTWPQVKRFEELIYPKGTTDALSDAFPHYQNGPVWNYDNFGPITVPKKGASVKLDSLSTPIYERVITVYEGNQLEKRADGYYINGQKSDSYTFKMDYYWMMGDNRHNSADSRGWGFVPEDHIVGKALFTWMSWDKDGSFLSKIRWNRIFKGIE